jgi:hypothetical protein
VETRIADGGASDNVVVKKGGGVGAFIATGVNVRTQLYRGVRKITVKDLQTNVPK